VGGNLLNADGSFQSGYMDHHTLWRVFLDITKLGHLGRVYYPSHPRGNAIKVVDWICSAFLLCRREALDEVGLFDEEYFIYSDETAFQYQMAQAGWKIYYLPDVETVHFGGKALNPWRRRRLVYRGYLIFFRSTAVRINHSCCGPCSSSPAPSSSSSGRWPGRSHAGGNVPGMSCAPTLRSCACASSQKLKPLNP
jgi:GT2 family glycosyltransferase